MRRAAKVDANQAQIVSALRAAGASVSSLAPVGQGVPDLLAGFRGQNFLLECKDGRRRPSERTLTPAQQEWIASWRGTVHVVLCPEDALKAIGIETRQQL